MIYLLFFIVLSSHYFYWTCSGTYGNFSRYLRETYDKNYLPQLSYLLIFNSNYLIYYYSVLLQMGAKLFTCMVVLFGCACAGAAPTNEVLEKVAVQEQEKDDLQAASSSCKLIYIIKIFSSDIKRPLNLSNLNH